jgi:FtsP/CotA-like multicopper oxidase with cupredoxin domain
MNQLTPVPFQGTFWYHSHFNNQYCDGLRGAFIIDDPDDPHKSLYDIDNGEKRPRRNVQLSEIPL